VDRLKGSLPDMPTGLDYDDGLSLSGSPRNDEGPRGFDIMTIAPVNSLSHLADALAEMGQGGDEKHRPDDGQCKNLRPDHIETGAAIKIAWERQRVRGGATA